MKKIKIDKVAEYLYYEKLNNGLEIYIIPNNHQNNYYITYNVKFGSINTEFKRESDKSFTTVPNGIAHYIEHLKFNLEGASAFDFFAKTSASVNAFTTYELTCYEVYSSTNFKENLLYLLKYVDTPYFTNELINNERGIINEEIRMYDNNPNTDLTYSSYKNIFINDKRKNLISGSIEDIKEINKNNILDCYNTFYNPNNMFVIVTGNVNPKETISIIKEYEKDRTYTNFDIVNKVIKEPKIVNEEYVEKSMNVECNKVNYSFKIPKSSFKHLGLKDMEIKTYSSILFDILFGSTSDIVDELISSKIINDSFNINTILTNEYIIVSLTCESDYSDVLINKIKKSLKNVDIDEKTMQRKIKVYKSNYILSFDNILSTNYNIQNDIIEFKEFTSNCMNIYNNIDLTILKKIYKLLNSVPTSVLIIKPKD